MPQEPSERMKILLAEDSVADRTRLAEALSTWDYADVEASDGAQAWRLFDRRLFPIDVQPRAATSGIRVLNRRTTEWPSPLRLSLRFDAQSPLTRKQQSTSTVAAGRLGAVRTYLDRSTRTSSRSLRAKTLCMANAGCDQIVMRRCTRRVGSTRRARLISS